MTDRNVRRSLVVGGTGMLAGAALALADRGDRVTVVGRNPRGISSLEAAASGLVGRLRCLQIDYSDDPAFASALSAVQASEGPFDLVIAWIHATAPNAPAVLADALEDGGTESTLFHVLSSSSVDPSVPDPKRLALFRARPSIRYREIILGFARENARTRWLTDREIVEGVLEAVDTDSPRHIVGSIRPWRDHPR